MDHQSIDTITSRIQKLEKLMRGEIHDSGISDSLVNHQGLLDCLYVLFNECQTQNLLKNKYVYEFVKKYKKTVQEIGRLRMKVSDFDVKEIIGRGHFGEVRVVRERATGTVHAMKVLDKSKTLAQAEVSFFNEEKEIMAKADSCWITKLHYTFQDANYLYFVMEFYPGGDLLSLLSRYNDIFDENMARFYLAEMVLAIHAVHSMGYIHRDIKPENVLLDRNGHIRLADFGSAAKMSSKNLVSSHIPVGTPDYVAPELLSMNTTQRYSVEVDWWSLGVCGYEMLYGLTPFSSSDNSKSGTYNKIMNYQELRTLQYALLGELGLTSDVSIPPEDFRKHYLKFPSIEVPDEAVDLLKHLLTDAKCRLDYQSLVLHPFFKNVEWQNIRNETSPFVPNVCSLDDTSNFDEYERIPPQPKFDDPKMRRDFSGKDLPFVGFTYFGPSGEESIDSSVVTSGVTSSEYDESTDDGKPSNVKLTLTVNVKDHQKMTERCRDLECSESLLRTELEEIKLLCDRKDLTVQKLQDDKILLSKDLSVSTDKSGMLAKRLEQEIDAKDWVHKQGLTLLNDINRFNLEAEDIKCAITQGKLDELKEMIKVLEGQNASMMKQLFSKDRTLAEGQKHLLSTQEQLERLQNRLDKERKKSMEDQRRDLSRIKNVEEGFRLQLRDKDDEISRLQDIIDDISQQNLQKECEFCRDGEFLDKAEKIADDMSKKYENENKLRKHIEKKLEEELKYKKSNDRRLVDNVESLKEQLANNEERLEYQNNMIKDLLDKADDQDKTWLKIKEELELKVKNLMEENQELKEKDKSSAELKLSLLQQVNFYQDEVKKTLKDKIKSEDDSINSELQERIMDLQKQSDNDYAEKKMYEDREQRHLQKIKELEEHLDDRNSNNTNDEQLLLAKIKELENQLDQENVDNKLLESKEQRLQEELKTLGTEVDHISAGKKMLETKEQHLLEKVKALETESEQVGSAKKILENKEQRLLDKNKALEHDLEQERIGRKLAEAKERRLGDSAKTLENKLDDALSSKKQLDNKERRNLEKIKQLEIQLEKETSERKLFENKERRLQERVRELENMLEKENSSKTSLETKERRLMDKLKSIENQLTQDEMAKQQSENKVLQLQDRVKELEQQLDKKEKLTDGTERQMEEKIKLLKDEVRSYSSKEKLGESHERHLKSRIESKELEIERLKADKTDVRKKDREYREKIMELEQKLELETIDKQRLDRKNRQLSRIIEDFERDSEKFNSAKNEVKRNERIHKDRIKELQDEVERHKAKAKNRPEPLSRSVSVSRLQSKFTDGTFNKKSDDTKIQSLEQDKAHLEAKLSTLETLVKEYQSTIANLKEDIMKQDANNKELVKTLTEELTSWEDEAGKMKDRLLLQLEKMKAQKDKAEEKMMTTRHTSDKWQQELKNSVENLTDSQRKAKVLHKELEESQRRAGQSQWELEKLRREFDKLQSNYVEMSKKLSDDKFDQESLSSLQSSNSHLSNEVKLFRSKEEKAMRMCREYEDKYKSCNREKSSLLMEKQSFIHEVQDVRHQLELEKRATENMKTVCKELEIQLIECESVIKQHEQKEADWNRKKAEYEEALKMQVADVEKSEKMLQSEMIARDADTNILSSLTQKLNSNKTDYIDEINALRHQLEEAKKKLSKCFHQLSIAEKRGTKLDEEKGEIKRKLSTNKDYESQLKELCSKQSVELDSLREENRKIKDNWQEAMDKFEMIFGEKVDLERVMELLQSSYCLEKYRFESMMGQQMKLIDYMQALIPDASTKKKKCPRLFGSFKSKDGPPKIQPRLPGDSEKRIAKLQEQVDKLRQENYQLASEVMTFKTGNTDPRDFLTGRNAISDPMVISKLGKSPTNQALSKLTTSVSSSGISKSAPGTPLAPAKPPRARMNHNIPHRFVSGYNTRATKCAVCLGNVPFVSQASKCEECHIVCHLKCESLSPANCGLLPEYIENFTSFMRKMDANEAANSSFTEDNDQHSNPCEMSTYLKVQKSGRNVWDNCWAKLDGSLLMIYGDKDDSSPSDTFELCPENDCEVVVHSAVTAAELPNTASSDLLYIMKVEMIPETTCWPGKLLYLMCMTFSEKQQWAAALEAIVKKKNNANKQMRLLHTVILQLDESHKIELNCSLLLNKQSLLLGGEEGLFITEIQDSSYSLYSTPLKIMGVDSVYHMQSTSSLGLIVLLVGEERTLITIKKKCLRNKHFQSNPIPYENLDKVTRCTVFDIGLWKDCVYLCAGMIDKVILLKFNNGLNKFCVRKEFSAIPEPCSCVCIAEKLAIIGTDRFQCIDFENPALKDFIDTKDVSFNCVINSHSLPLDVLKISPKEGPPEFLLCFNEFGIFVDCRGRRSRQNNLRWSGLPLAFAMHDPYLFVTYFNCVQATTIPMNRSQIKGKQMSFVKVRPRYLGTAPGIGSAFFAYICQKRTEMVCLRGFNGNHNMDSDAMWAADPDDDALPGSQRHVHFVSPEKTRRIRKSSSWSSFDGLEPASNTNSISSNSSQDARHIYATVRRKEPKTRHY